MLNFIGLVKWYIAGLVVFEFLPVLLVPLLLLPWISQKSAAARQDCLVAICLLISIHAYIIAIALMSQVTTKTGTVVAIRYLVPIFPFIAIISATALITAWHYSRSLSMIFGGLLVFSNALYLLPITSEYGGSVRCSLCDYIGERFNDYTTGSEGYIEAIGRIRPGTSVLVVPGHMSVSPMFYLPKITYCNQLDHRVLPQITIEDELPKCVVTGSGCADMVVFGGLPTGPDTKKALEATVSLGGCRYKARALTPVYWKDESRPEVPWHSFRRPPDRLAEQQGIVTFERY